MRNIKIITTPVLFILVLTTFVGCTGSGTYYDGYGNSNYEEEYYDDYVTSDNWECTDDCSGHEAGYEWAEENGITDPSDCGGNSNSFIEGCEAYGNEYLDQEDYYEEEYYY